MTRATIPDKREGACRTGPCRMPRRCWQYQTCFLYGQGTERVDAGRVPEAGDETP